MRRPLSYLFGLGVAGLAHLAVIPVMSVYGVHVCPVLSRMGIGFGMRFNSTFIGGILLANAAFALAIYRGTRRAAVFRYFPALSMIGHLAAFALGIHFLTRYLRELHVPRYTLEHLNGAFTYTAILIAVLQANIVDWLTQEWLRAKPVPERKTGLDDAGNRALGFTSRWALHGFWSALPYAAVLAITGMALYRSLLDLVAAERLASEAVYLLIVQGIQIVGMLLAWLLLVKLFTFLKERQLVTAVHRHLDALGRLDTRHYSPSIAAGYWESIFMALNRTTDIVNQRARLIKGFSAYVTNSVVEKVLERDELKPEGELRELTIIMSDLRDFTKMSNSLTAEQVVRVLNVYFADMIEVLTENGATLDKFIGDGILAYIEPNPSHPETPHELAVRAAIAMHRKLVETNAKLAGLALPQLKLGVAVHAGQVVLGTIGAPEKMQHTMIGDPVNVAARLESLCKTHAVGVIASDVVFNALDPERRKQFKDLGPQQIRGLRSELRIFGLSINA